MKSYLKVILFALVVAACSCSSDEPEIDRSPLPTNMRLEIIMEDEAGLNVLNTLPDTFSLIDDKLVIFFDYKKHNPNAMEVLSDGYCEYFDCDTCMAFLKEGQSNNFVLCLTPIAPMNM